MNDYLEQLEDIGAIAIVGMAGEFSGAADVQAFWHNLATGQSAARRTTPEQARQQGISDSQLEHPDYVPWSMPINDIDEFDHVLFGIPEPQAKLLDPQFRRFLQVCWHALEDACYNPRGLTRYDVAVIAACNGNGYLLPGADELANTGDHARSLQMLTGNASDFLATRVAYHLGLTGPAQTVQTACSGSLVAVVNACQQLQSYQCDMALAGGVGLTLPQSPGYVHQAGSILSSDGTCRPFDAQANGTLNGSAVAAVVLRRLEDAVADGDNIRAVIRAGAINNDGAERMDFMAPGVKGQSRIVARALQLAELTPDQLQYVECHGTGTALGDPIEVQALHDVYKGLPEGSVGIGSVKSNIGHANAAAGITGLIKTVLALEHGQIPATLNYESPNPGLHLDQTPFRVIDRLTDWPKCERRRAGISSLGFGGTNAHLILEEAPSLVSNSTSPGPVVLPISAMSEEQLARSHRSLEHWLQTQPGMNSTTLHRLAQSVQKGRHAFLYRRAVCGSDSASVIAALRQPWSEQPEPCGGSLTFGFTGQGASYAGMAYPLLQRNALFRGICDDVDMALAADSPLMPACQYWLDPEADIGVSAEAAHYYQFCYQYALARCWQQLGVQPQQLIGHSLGEYAAACLAGVFTVQDAVTLVCQRGRAIDQHCRGDWGMLMVAASASEIAPLLNEESGTHNVEIAVVNAAQRLVLSGSRTSLQKLAVTVEQAGYRSRLLDTTHGFHSGQMEPALSAFRECCHEIHFSLPTIPIISSMTGKPVSCMDADYWVQQLRAPVRFDQVSASLVASGQGIDFIECGPQGVLGSLLQSLPGVRVRNSWSQDSALDWVQSLANFWCAGADIDWRPLQQPGLSSISAPGYPFAPIRLWSDQSVSRLNWRSEQASEPSQQCDSVSDNDNDDELTGWLGGLWRDHLGAHVPLNEQSDFYQLGGNSLAAIQICDQVEKSVAVRISVADFLQARTFGAFVQLLLDATEQTLIDQGETA